MAAFRTLARVWRVTVAAAALVSAGVAASCSSDDEPTPGQLVLAFQTDMDVPKDVEAMRVVVKSFGVTLLDNTYTLGGGAQGTPLPATLTIVANDDPSTPVSIQLIALGQDKARVVRKAVTTVPDKRTALLPLPIQFLCWDDVTVTEDDTGVTAADKTCGDQTCIAGGCKDPVIDSATLGDYSAAAVFGGASGPGALGVCLDVLSCFSQGQEVPVQLSDCSIALPANVDTTNIGLVVPLGSQGICGPTSCIVPLDRDALLGWVEAGGRAVLPAAVCNKLGTTVKAVAVTTTCGAKTPAIPTCGPWSSVTSLPGTQDASGPTPLDGGAGDAGADGAENFCAGSADGDYCGVTLGGPANRLYTCQAGNVVTSVDCPPGGCVSNGAKSFCSTDAGNDASIGPGPANELGKACQNDTECGPLKCIQAGSGALGGAGPASGICTWPCAPNNPVCSTIKGSAICHSFSPPGGAAFCLEACDPTAPAGGKCSGRSADMACTPLMDIGSTSLPFKHACLPVCNVNTGCGALLCHPDGLCRAGDPPQTQAGEDCTADGGGPGMCNAGICTPFPDPEGGIGAFACTEPCTLGATAACRYQPGVTQTPTHGCFLPADPQNTNAGNLGLCTQLCDCTTLCSNPGFECLEFPVGTASDFTGPWMGYCGPTGSGTPANGC